MIAPGATIGIVGGGQLGRMLSVAAAQLGYRTHIFDPHEQPCAADVTAEFTRAAFDDRAALERFAASCDVVTYEFENLSVEPLAGIGDKLRPGTRSLAVAQDRATEKSFIERTGGRVAPWRAVESLAEVEQAVAELGCPLVLKTRRYGYDGKGQAWVRAPEQAADAWAAISEQPAVAERGMTFAAEFSIILARGLGGEIAILPAPRNDHRDGILRTSTVPAGPVVAPLVPAAEAMARAIAEALGHVGVLTVEFFACADGPVVNEIAPRVHNSGHWSIEGAATSQFEQHLRAILDLPLGSTALRGNGATMDNLIGDEVHRWPELIAESGASLHLYGKGEARPGRKMGHVTRVR
ncbi:5-(carboxyamino)imidazole ribonucleotide synthase [Sphingomonas sp. KRR8]|uniref:5-(carboxyamino)imidazole ribonucleotide synthase n=1 Tax=Sphingomonas sp. KRR8 TaxID=2942996 RepID=UPI00202180FD|nr:5-(carboxyamino)imidazole ribonucleotide synthase [Sphingomonas sp. KRR8]URD60404.1 5-(carboxyamino)imidazole ribonucleotide synthase [Sphingomonas sp. KRR8]